MALSFRDVVHKRYGITGRFSLRGTILGKLDPDINFRTPEGKVSLLLILTPPLKATIVSFKASVTQGTGVVNLTWHVEPPTPWLSQNIQVGLLHEPGFVFLPLTGFDLPLSGSHSDPPSLGTTTYRLIAWVKVQGGNLETTQDVSVLITQQGPTASPTPSAPPSMSGVRQVQLYNCSSDQRTVYIWVRDLNMGTQVNYGTLPAQYDASGGCPESGATPFVVSFPNSGHQYEVVAVDPELLTCGEQNDPTIVGCRRWAQTFTSSADGSLFQDTIP